MTRVFERIVCGVDGSPEGFDAVRRAARLATGDVVLVSCVDVVTATRTGPMAGQLVETLQAEARKHLIHAQSLVPHLRTETRVLSGPPLRMLLDTIRSEQATLIGVGSMGHGRVAGIVFGSVATGLLRQAACSVLIARPTDDAEAFPTKIAVGVDGSASAMAAVDAAMDISRRLHAEVNLIVATGGSGDIPPVAELEARMEGLTVDPRQPVDALSDAAMRSDLVILGTRGLRGLRALGSVSERVAHRAPCAVMTVLGVAWPSRN